MRLRFWLGIAAVLLIAAGSVIAAVLVYENDHSDFHLMQQDEAARAARQAESVAALSVGQLSSTAAFFQAKPTVNAHEFAVIGHSSLHQGALDAAAFIPRVPGPRRAEFERTHQLEILEAGPGGLQRARRRPVYFPVTYVSTNKGPQQALGYDLGSDPKRSPFLARARDAGTPVATPLVMLLLGGAGINVYSAIYRDGAPVETAAERRRALVGYVAGAFRIEDLAAAAVDALPDDVEAQLRVDRRRAFGARGALPDAASAPIHIADRTWLLVVKDPGGPNLSLPLVMAGMGIALAALLASLIFAWRRNERLQELGRQAGEDPLTGLPNRRRFEEDLAAAMARARRDRTTGGLLMLDLDHFKRVNDSQGHPAGDQLIEEVAAVLRGRTRAGDALARLGGDEFAMILPHCSRAEARLAGEAIAAAVREHRPGNAIEPITASVGIAMFGEDPRTGAATVVAEADSAMYAAKDAGRDGVRVFDPLSVQDREPGES